MGKIVNLTDRQIQVPQDDDEAHRDWMLGRLPHRMSEKSMQKSHKKREFESSPNSHCER